MNAILIRAQAPDPDRIPRIKLANETPKQAWWFMGTFIGLVAVGHFAALAHAYATRNRPARPAADVPPSLRWKTVRVKRIPLALLNVYRTIAFRWAISINFLGAYTINTAEFLLAGVYFTVLFCWTRLQATNLEGMKYDPKYWANRCAHIAAVQLPLNAALGMKNNPLSFLTGVSFDKLEHLHRATARVLVVMFWVHGAGRIILPLGDDRHTYWFHIGATATTALTILAIMSVRPIRVRAHESFMYAHTILGVLGLAGACVHAAEFGYTPSSIAHFSTATDSELVNRYPYLVWPAMFVWGLDRVIRLVRVLLVNSQLIDHDPRRITSRATVSVLPNPGFMRILVEAPHYMIWQPGQSMYLTLVGAYATSVLESHPFTIANVPGWAALLGDEGESADVDGLHPASFPAFLDGPYSSPPVVRGYERVLFICGGSGVSFALPLFLDLVHAATLGQNVCCTRAVFVWAIRDREQIDWIADTLVRALTAVDASVEAAKGLDVEVRVHVTKSVEYTQATEPLAVDLEQGEAEKDKEAESPAKRDASVDDSVGTTRERLLSLPDVSLVEGRPNLDEIVRGEIASMHGGSIGINVCGTTELATGVRNALNNPLERFKDVAKGGPSVVLHVEGFGNA
ncbi:FAD-binding FR-type domain-containing protein [Mycena chlorophos]|uniref:FAD-binding FR-type domain-containing protein n=1 Tax=Mycena chlorophos TaxID=658473 RepID=A0A8H6SJB1_MYCCL|nr:FAD-binding FR-type domain-containing protein [Mycena chlorophos]